MPGAACSRLAVAVVAWLCACTAPVGHLRPPGLPDGGRVSGGLAIGAARLSGHELVGTGQGWATVAIRRDPRRSLPSRPYMQWEVGGVAAWETGFSGNAILRAIGVLPGLGSAAIDTEVGLGGLALTLVAAWNPVPDLAIYAAPGLRVERDGRFVRLPVGVQLWLGPAGVVAEAGVHYLPGSRWEFGTGVLRDNNYAYALLGLTVRQTGWW